MPNSDVATLLKEAHERGFSIIPVLRDKRPMFSWKPFQERRATVEEIRKWWARKPAGWAVITGAISGIVILDFDGDEGLRTLEKLGLERHVVTGSGGAHLYLTHPGWSVKTLNSKTKYSLGERYPGLDIRGDGGYAVFAGCNEKGVYEWVRSMEPDSLDVLPLELRLFLGLMNSLEEEVSIQQALDLVKTGGGRNNAGFTLAMQLRDKGYAEPDAMRVLTAYRIQTPPTNAKGHLEPYTEAEVAESIRQAYRRSPRNHHNESGQEEETTDETEEPANRVLPTIVVSDRELRDVSRDSLAALTGANNPPLLFARNRQMVHVVHDEEGHSAVREVTEAFLRGRLTRSANYCRQWGGRNGDPFQTPTNPPIEVVRDILALSPADWQFPPLESVTESPIIRPDGSILSSPGYDATTKVFYAPSPDLRLPPIADNPSAGEIASSTALLQEVLEGFPFVNQASRANAIAMLLTPTVRRAVRGNVPVALIDAPEAGTGKSLLAEIVAIIHTGADAAMKPAPSHDEEEWRKTLSAVLLAASPLTIFDNVAYRLDSGSLALAVTASTWTDRLLGQTVTLTVPQRTSWIVTGNNLMLGGDMPRRCYWIRLDAAISQPWQRTGFRIEDLRKWTREKRGLLQGALLTLCQSWFAAGQPQVSTPILGSFEGWCRTIGGILANAGINDFLKNLESLYEQSDPSKAQWESFLAAIFEEYEGGTFTVHQLVELIRSGDSISQAVPEELVDDGKGTSFQRRIATAFRQRHERRYGSKGLHLTRAGEARNKVVLWRVTVQDSD